MQTKMEVLGDKLIEAGWLVAALLVPFFIDVYGSRHFVKVGLVWAIALVMLFGWLVKRLEGVGGGEDQEGDGRDGDVEIRLVGRFVRDPLIVTALLLAGAFVLSTATSVAPRISLWGHYMRPQGTLTYLAYTILFLLTLTHLRSRRQLAWLVTALLLASFPVALYGVLQHYGLDPLRLTEGAPRRVYSTLGNPIPLGGYVLLVMPVTAGWLLDRLWTGRGRREQGRGGVLSIGLYGLLLIVQGLCVYFTQGRGVLLGLLVGGFFFVLLGALALGHRKLVAVTAIAGVLGVLFLALLSLPNTPLTPLEQVPYLNQFLGSLGERDFQARVAFWQSILAMSTADLGRLLVGSGPDTLFIAFPPYSTAELARLLPQSRPDQAHNLVFHLLATTGLIGVGTYLLFFMAAVYAGLRALGLIRGRRQGVLWLGLGLGGGLASLGLGRLVAGSWDLVGVTGPLGLLAGWVFYLVVRSVWGGEITPLTERSGFTWLLIGILAALVAHLVEAQFGLFTAPIGVTFWLSAALVGCLRGGELGTVGTSPAVPQGSRQPSRHPAWRGGAGRAGHWAGLAAGLLVGLLLMTAIFGLITVLFTFDRRGQGIVGLMVLLWVVGGALWLVALRRWPSPGEGTSFAWPLYALGSLGWAGLFFIPYWTVVRSPVAEVAKVEIVYYVFLILGLGAVAGALGSQVGWPRRWGRGARTAVYPLLGLICVALIAQTSIRLGWADAYFMLGRYSLKQGQNERAIGFYQRAVDLEPDEDRYHLYIGFSGLNILRGTSSPEEGARWVQITQRALERAHELNPLEPDSLINLGHLYRLWALRSPDPQTQVARMEQALAYYQRALERSPHEKEKRIREALWMTYSGLGDAYGLQNQVGPAIAAYENAKALNPDHFAVRWNLVVTYHAAGLTEQALREAEAALAYAPEERKEALQSLISELKAASTDE